MHKVLYNYITGYANNGISQSTTVYEGGSHGGLSSDSPLQRVYGSVQYPLTAGSNAMKVGNITTPGGGQLHIQIKGLYFCHCFLQCYKYRILLFENNAIFELFFNYKYI